MSDRLHTHLDLGLRPQGVCPACEQVREGVNEVREAVAAGQETSNTTSTRSLTPTARA